jgi:hypothetical protein
VLLVVAVTVFLDRSARPIQHAFGFGHSGVEWMRGKQQLSTFLDNALRTPEPPPSLAWFVCRRHAPSFLCPNVRRNPSENAMMEYACIARDLSALCELCV